MISITGPGGVKKDEIFDIMMAGGIIITNDTANKINDLKDLILLARQESPNHSNIQIQLILDEADNFYRAAPDAEKVPKVQIAWKKLEGAVQPLLRYQVSASLSPVFYYVREKQNVQADSIIYTIPGDDYIGVCDFQPFQIGGISVVLKSVASAASPWRGCSFFSNFRLRGWPKSVKCSDTGM